MSEKERAMTDFNLPPEAVEAAIVAHHNFVLGEDVPLTKRDIGIAFQAMHVALAAALPHIVIPPTAKPTLEQVVDVLAAQPAGRGGSTSRRIMQTARAVLALRPGRSGAAVAAEALRDAAQDARLCWTGTNNLRDQDAPEKAYSFDAWLDVRADHIEKEADRG